MKSLRKSIILSLLLVTILLSGCYGNFNLTRKIYNWNGTVGDKYIQSAVGWGMVIIPIYMTAPLIDAAFFNLVEFWTGDNPLTMKIGEIDSRIITTKEGRYELTASQNRFDLVALDGENIGDYMSFVFNSQDQEWILEKDGESKVVAKFHGETVELIYPSGKTEFYKM